MKDRPHPTRRQLLRNAGLAMAASPFVGRNALAQQARLAGAPGLLADDERRRRRARSTRRGSATQLSLITEPLRKWASQVTFIKGVNISGSSNHYAVRSTYSGFPIATYESADPNVKSVDQLVADQIAATSPMPLKSLHLGVIPADSINYYQRVGRTTLFFAPKPVDYEANPVTAFDRLFGGTVALERPHPDLLRLHPRRARRARGGDDRAERPRSAPAPPARLAKLTQHRESWQELRGKPAPAAGAMGGMGGGSSPRSRSCGRCCRATPRTPTSTPTSTTCSTPRSTSWRARWSAA